MSGRVFVLVYIIFTVSYQPTLWAEFECSSALSYVWKQKKESKKEYFETVFAKGADDALARQNLQGTIKAREPKGLVLCRDLHENLSGCLLSRTKNFSNNVVNVTAYAIRKEFLKAVQDDCNRQLGECHGVESSEPVCSEIKAAVAETDQTGEKDKKEKEKGSKGK
jgi:hypothetical protein